MKLLTVLVVLVIFLGFQSSKAQKAPPAIYVFGDSLVDVGNNNYLPLSVAKANFLPNGIDFHRNATGRFSNGMNSADWVALKLGLPMAPPYLSFKTKNVSSPLTGVSFASAAAGILNGTNNYYGGLCLSMELQISDFEELGGEYEQRLGRSGVKDHFDKSIIAIVIGSNDVLFYSRTPRLKNKTAPGPYVDSMAATLKQQLKKLHSFGARKFVFPGLGPLGCIPRRRRQNDGNCEELSNSMAAMYNQRLKSILQQLKSELGGFSYSYFDTFTVVQNMVQSPAAYGFSEVKAACCGFGTLEAKSPCLPISSYCSNRTNHLFWDAFHPSEAAAGILASNIVDGPPQYSFPVNVRQLAAV